MKKNPVYKIIQKLLIICSFILTTGLLFSKENDNLKNIRLLIQEYKYQQALQLIARQHPEPEVLKEKALCYKALGDYPQARAILLQLQETLPADKTLLAELADTYKAESNWKDALGCYTGLSEADTSNIYFRIKKAEMFYLLDRNVEALTEYRDIYARRQMSTLYYPLGKCFEELNKADSAIYYYKQAWIAQPSDIKILSALVKMAIRAKRLDIALESCAEYTARDSTNAQINSLYASSLYLSNNYPKAAQLYEKCKQQGDSSLVVTRGLGMCYYAMQKDEPAYQNLKFAYRKDSSDVQILGSLGAVCNNLYNLDEALLYYSKLLEIVIPPDNILYQGYMGLAIANKGLRAFDSAIRDFKTAQTYGNAKEKASVDRNLAELYQYSLKDSRTALGYYKKYALYLKEYTEQLKERRGEESVEYESNYKQLDLLQKYIDNMEKNNKSK